MNKPVVNEKLMEILIELGNIGIPETLEPNKYYASKVTQAHDQIIELFRECLPKQREIKKEDWIIDECPMSMGHVICAENCIITEAEKKIGGEGYA